MIRTLKAVVLVCAGLFFPLGKAEAQISPFRGTLTYSASQAAWLRLIVKAENGSAAYVLTLRPDPDIYKNVMHLDLVLQRPQAKPDSPNLLEPEHRWHGLQEYMFNASEFANGSDNSDFGLTRHIRVKRHNLVVMFSVKNVKVRPAAKAAFPDEYVFDELTLDVSVDNAKRDIAR